MEALFLKLHGKNAKTVVYAGSAPGFHINELIEQFKSALKAENMKFTPQRLSVLAEMINNKEHFIIIV